MTLLKWLYIVKKLMNIKRTFIDGEIKQKCLNFFDHIWNFTSSFKNREIGQKCLKFFLSYLKFHFKFQKRRNLTKMSELLWSYLKFHFQCQRMIDWFQVSWAQISVSFPTTGLSFFFNGFASGKFFMLIHIQSPILFFFYISRRRSHFF